MADESRDLTPPGGSERSRRGGGASRLLHPVDVTGRISMHTGDDKRGALAMVVIADRSLVRSADRAGNRDNPGPSKSMAKSIG